MIMPLNLPQIEDKLFMDICIKHINAGLQKGLDLALTNMKDIKTNTERIIYWRQFFPKGFYGNYTQEVYRLYDIISSKMLYLLGDFDKYIIMSLLTNFYRNETEEYSLETADKILFGELNETGRLNYNVIKKKEERDYVLSQLALANTNLDLALSTLEDLNQYMQTCFLDIDFLTLGDFSLEEIKALTTMREYSSIGFELEETRLHCPYVIIK